MNTLTSAVSTTSTKEEEITKGIESSLVQELQCNQQDVLHPVQSKSVMPIHTPSSFLKMPSAPLTYQTSFSRQL